MVHRHDWRYIHYFFEQLQWITYMQGQYPTKKRFRLKRRITLDSEINIVTNRYATYPTTHLGHVSIKHRYLSLECKVQFEYRFLLLSCFRNVLFGHCNRCSNQRKQRLLYLRYAAVDLQSTFMVDAFLISRCCGFGKYDW